MICDQRDRMEWVGFHQRPGEDLTHVVIAALTRGFMEFHLQRRIKQHGITVNKVDVLL